MMGLLRALAVLIAIAGIIDPVLVASGKRRVRVDVVASSPVESLSARVIRDLGSDVLVNTGDRPDAVVIVEGTAQSQPLPAGVPVSVVMPLPSNGPNVRLASVNLQAPAPV
jgi:hypothetical protein